MPKLVRPPMRRWTFLRRARLDKHMSLADLAEAAGYHYTHICQIEQGRVGPSDEAIRRIARILDVSPAELDRTKPTPPPRVRPPKRQLAPRRAPRRCDNETSAGAA